MTRCVLGVDGGGSKTTCVAASLDGQALGRGAAGASNYQGVGIDEAARRVGAAIQQALDAARAAGHADLDVTGLCLALAGAARPEDHRVWREAIPSLPGCARLAETAVVTHDAMAALVGGTGARQGVVCIAGTGAIAFGVNAQGEERRASGWGYLMGDEGSGYAIGLAALRAVCRAEDGRGPVTALTRLVLEAHGLSRPQELVRLVYGSWKPADVAAFAPLVMRAAADGDAVAQTILQAAASELALAAQAVISGLRMAEAPVEVVTAGGLWAGAPSLRAAFTARLAETATRAAVIWPRQEPVMGAVQLALETTGSGGAGRSTATVAG